MGREVRRVPANWEHPKNENGHYVPLLDGDFAERLADWEQGYAKWQEGFRLNWVHSPDPEAVWVPLEPDDGTYEDWDGKRPDPADYMPQWKEEEKTHWQMYENVSEGTPISPVMESPEALARWLADNEANAGAYRTATYEQWLSTIHRGYALSMVSTPQTGLVSGVEAMHEIEKDKS